MTTEHAISILRMSEQARWQSGVDHCDVVTALDMATAALRKQKAMKPTHEATVRTANTCPNCKNVIDRFENFNGQKVRVLAPHCSICGQKIDWSDGQEATT